MELRLFDSYTTLLFVYHSRWERLSLHCYYLFEKDIHRNYASKLGASIGYLQLVFDSITRKTKIKCEKFVESTFMLSVEFPSSYILLFVWFVFFFSLCEHWTAAHSKCTGLWHWVFYITRASYRLKCLYDSTGDFLNSFLLII